MIVLLIFLLNNLTSWAGTWPSLAATAPSFDSWTCKFLILKTTTLLLLTASLIPGSEAHGTDSFTQKFHFKWASVQSWKLPVNGIMTEVPRLFQFFSVTHYCSNHKLVPWDSPVQPLRPHYWRSLPINKIIVLDW